MSDLYRICVGEIGIDPDYFFNQATLHEMELAVEGYRNKQLHEWEQTRFLGWIIASKFNKKHIDINKFLPLSKPYSDEVKNKPIVMDESEINRLRKKAQKYIEDTYGKEPDS